MPCSKFAFPLALACLVASEASAQTNSTVEQVVVTATRTPEPADQIPADVSIVSGVELRQRNAWDMQTALSLVPGVEAPAGGDAGPSSSVPAFWGLHEFDAFLLIVDQVPWGARSIRRFRRSILPMSSASRF